MNLVLVDGDRKVPLLEDLEGGKPLLAAHVKGGSLVVARGGAAPDEMHIFVLVMVLELLEELAQGQDQSGFPIMPRAIIAAHRGEEAIRQALAEMDQMSVSGLHTEAVRVLQVRRLMKAAELQKPEPPGSAS